MSYFVKKQKQAESELTMHKFVNQTALRELCRSKALMSGANEDMLARMTDVGFQMASTYIEEAMEMMKHAGRKTLMPQDAIVVVNRHTKAKGLQPVLNQSMKP